VEECGVEEWSVCECGGVWSVECGMEGGGEWRRVVRSRGVRGVSRRMSRGVRVRCEVKRSFYKRTSTYQKT
jgi:hypothetical protein